MTTTNAFHISQTWTSVTSLTGREVGSEFILQNVGLPGDIIEVSFSDVAPAADFHGLQLDQLKSYYQVAPGLQECWVKFKRNDKSLPPLRVGLLQVTDANTVSPYMGIPGSAIGDNGVGSNVVKVISEPSAVASALNGNVYTIAGSVTLGGSGTAALNLNLTDSIILRRCRAITPGRSGEDIEITVYSTVATGTVNNTISAKNINSCSTNTTAVTADQINTATPPTAEFVREFGENQLESPIAIGCVDTDLSIVFSRRDNGTAQEVKFILTFEVLPQRPGDKPPQLQLEPNTQLIETTEMSIYG